VRYDGRMSVTLALVVVFAQVYAEKPKPKRRPRSPVVRPAAAVAPRHESGIVVDRGEGVILDWTRGKLLVGAIGPADLHAPNVSVARAGSERVARKWAEARILAAAKKVPVVAGVDVAAVAPRDWIVEYGSDGSTRVELEIPLGLMTPGEMSPGAASIVVDARHLPLRPILGLALRSGATRYAGPTTFTDQEASAGGLRATAVSGGTLQVDVDENKLAALARERAPVVIVVNPKP
jgi:hypothetical protein